MPGGNTRSVLHYAPFPLAFSSGEGASLISMDGDRYTDLLGEYTAGLYGHSHPVIMSAIRMALDSGISYGGHNAKEARLAALICERFPSVDLVRFTNSGTEANVMALATATAETGRRSVLVFRGGYHGGVLAFAVDSPLNLPHDFVLAEYNDVEGVRRILRERASSIAAVLVEPMLGSGGCIPATPEFLGMLREETRRIGAVLIFDEVMTSRLSVGGLQAVYGVTPDMTTLGKYLGGGMSFGAFGGSEALMRRFDPARDGAWQHAGTFNNNVLSMSAGVAGLEQVFTPDAVEELNARGDRLHRRLDELFENAGVAMQVTGIGSVLNVHATSAPLSTSADLRSSDEAVKELFFFDMLAAGFWLARRGMLALSLPLTDEDGDRFVAAVASFVERRAGLLPSR